MNLFKFAGFGAIGLIVGVVLTTFILKFTLPYALFKEVKSPYDHAHTVEVIKKRIAEQEGWKVSAEIDQQAAILACGGRDPGRHTIIKLCNGKKASQMLGTDDRLFFGVMMPISVAIYEKSNGQTYVAFMNGSLLSRLFGGEYERVITEVRMDMEEIFQFLHLSFDIMD